MGNIFAELQMQSANQLNTITYALKKMNQLLKLFLEQPDRELLCDIFARDIRNLETKNLLD